MQEEQQQQPQQQQATIVAEKHTREGKAAGVDGMAETVAQDLSRQIQASFQGKQDASPIKTVAEEGKKDMGQNAKPGTAKVAVAAPRNDLARGKASKATVGDDVDLEDDEGADSEQETAVISQAMKPLGSAQEEEYDSVAKAVEEDSKRAEEIRPNGFADADVAR